MDQPACARDRIAGLHRSAPRHGIELRRHRNAAAGVPTGAIRVGDQLCQVPIGEDEDGCPRFRLCSPARLVAQAIYDHDAAGGFTTDKHKAGWCASGALIAPKPMPKRRRATFAGLTTSSLRCPGSRLGVSARPPANQTGWVGNAWPDDQTRRVAPLPRVRASPASVRNDGAASGPRHAPVGPRYRGQAAGGSASSG